MKKDKLKKLSRYKFYKGYYGNGIAFEVGDGWLDMLLELSQKIQEFIDDGVETPEFSVVQVKSKFGGLRFYNNGCMPETELLIDEYEKKSAETCELCGKPAKSVVFGHWYYTLCKNCIQEIINMDKTRQN